jgi:hypothetical protein
MICAATVAAGAVLATAQLVGRDVPNACKFRAAQQSKRLLVQLDTAMCLTGFHAW